MTGLLTARVTESLEARINNGVDVSGAFDNCFFHCYATHLLANKLPLPVDLFEFNSVLGNQSIAKNIQALFPNEEALKVFEDYERLRDSKYPPKSPNHVVEKTLVLGFLLREWFATKMAKNYGHRNTMLQGESGILSTFNAYRDFITNQVIEKKELLTGPEGTKYASNEAFLDYFTARPITRKLTAEEQRFENYFTVGKDVNDAIVTYWQNEGYKNYCLFLSKPHGKLTFDDVTPVLKELGQPFTVYDSSNGAEQISIDGAKNLPPLEISLDVKEGHYYLLKSDNTKSLLREYEDSYEQYKVDRENILNEEGNKLAAAEDKKSLLVAAICPAEHMPKNPFVLLMDKIEAMKQFVEKQHMIQKQKEELARKQEELLKQKEIPKKETFSILTTDKLMEMINRMQAEICHPMFRTIFLSIDPRGEEKKPFPLKEKYKQSKEDFGLYSKILQSQLKKHDEINRALGKINDNNLFGQRYENDEASLKLHVNINNIGDIDKEIIYELIHLLVDQESVKDNNLSYHFKIVKPEKTNMERFKDTDQITIYLDKYSSAESVINLSEKIEVFLKKKGLHNSKILGPKDSFGFNNFVSARFDTNKLHDQYGEFQFFDLELGKFFKSSEKKALENVPLCALEAVFYHCLLNNDIKLNNQNPLTPETSIKVQEQFKIMVRDPKQYLENYYKSDSQVTQEQEKDLKAQQEILKQQEQAHLAQQELIKQEEKARLDQEQEKAPKNKAEKVKALEAEKRALENAERQKEQIRSQSPDSVHQVEDILPQGTEPKKAKDKPKKKAVIESTDVHIEARVEPVVIKPQPKIKDTQPKKKAVVDSHEEVIEQVSGPIQQVEQVVLDDDNVDKGPIKKAEPMVEDLEEEVIPDLDLFGPVHQNPYADTDPVIELPKETKPEPQKPVLPNIENQVYKQALFKKHIDALEIQVNDLKGRRDKGPVGSDDYRKLDAAYDKANGVHGTLKDAGKKYFAKEISYADFKKCSDDVIKDAKPVLEEHRGGKAVLEVLTNIALFLVSLIRSAYNGKMTFFKLNTESVTKVNAVEDSVNKAAPGA